ncbi:DUF2946 family protein [Niveispirillum sp. BGYR6]|uniref:DUF2946 family protein n=1 Tax=Niveispirillum sp. BGYR6 TaxID=2971249 RepID=UPI0022B9C147|nr:DUF2946 family protein [Niveispirillum sp. BGYR6]MDG5493924.1 hypothetical protein [Niveispirillum sp. BGYR6]
MAWLLLLALALRGLLAPGMMPAFAAGPGGPLITICTSMGERTIAVDGAQDGQLPHSAEAPCLFAAAGFTNLGAVTGPVLSRLVQWLPFLPQPPPPVRMASRKTHPAQARAPPMAMIPSTCPGSAA